MAKTKASLRKKERWREEKRKKSEEKGEETMCITMNAEYILNGPLRSETCPRVCPWRYNKGASVGRKSERCRERVREGVRS